MDKQPANISFLPKEVENYTKFFLTNGYVVIRDVLSQPEVSAMLDELWTHQSFLGSIPELDRKDPLTWAENWPTSGFVEPKHEHSAKCIWENRQNATVVQAFKNILSSLETSVEEKHLLVKTDRIGVMKPTKDIPLGDGTKLQRPNWKTQSSWLHLDQNPWSEPGWRRLQGFIAFTDHTETSGGFDCVPGFQNKFDEWAAATPIETTGHTLLHENIKIPKADPMWQDITHVLMPAGSLVIWDSRLPHQNWPNDDHTWRIVQYITFRYVDSEFVQQHQQLILKKIQNGMIPISFLDLTTDLGKAVFGLTVNGQPLPPIEPLTESQKTALELLDQARDAEANGDPRGAANLFRRAFKLNPALEEIFNEQEN